MQERKCPDFRKNGSCCVYLWVKFSIQNVVLRVSRRKNKVFQLGFFFLRFWRNIYQSVLGPRKFPSTEKIVVDRLHSGIILFPKRSILNVCQYSEYVCLDNCSVICTVTLFYVLYQIHPKFWHLQNFIYSGICRHIQAYSALWRHIQAYWGIIKAYSAPCATLAYSQLCHIHIQNLVKLWPNIFRIPPLSEQFIQTLIQAYSEPCVTQYLHIQNPGIFIPCFHYTG